MRTSINASHSIHPSCLGPQFKDHLKKAEAVSEFAKSKTIAEQRRFLPVYGVREEMLQVGGRRSRLRGWAVSALPCGSESCGSRCWSRCCRRAQRPSRHGCARAGPRGRVSGGGAVARAGASAGWRAWPPRACLRAPASAPAAHAPIRLARPLPTCARSSARTGRCCRAPSNVAWCHLTPLPLICRSSHTTGHPREPGGGVCSSVHQCTLGPRPWFPSLVLTHARPFLHNRLSARTRWWWWWARPAPARPRR